MTRLQSAVLAEQYRFTDGELDFIPSTKLRASFNYGIKTAWAAVQGRGIDERRA